MRFAAQKTIGMQDMLPANGSIYMCNMDNKMTSMMDALKAWEKKRGLSFSFKGKFLCSNPKKAEENKEKTKVKPTADRPITVPRDPMRPGRKPTLTKEQRRKNKNESNKRAREKNRQHHIEKSREWRAKLTPEQKAEIQRKAREWKRAKKAAANAGNGGGTAGVPLANSNLPGKER